MDIFVGSLPFKLEESELRVFFEQYGEVTSVKIIIDVNTRQNKGFGFVEMPNVSEGLKAIEGLNGFEIGGRALVVNKSEDKKDKKPGGFSGPNKSPGGGFGKGGFGKGGFGKSGGFNKGGFKSGGGSRKGGASRGNYVGFENSDLRFEDVEIWEFGNVKICSQLTVHSYWPFI